MMMMMMMMKGCALVAPGGSWCLTFAPEKLENLSFFIFFYRNHMQGTLDFTRQSSGLPLVINIT